jgi:hypothetical protein
MFGFPDFQMVRGHAMDIARDRLESFSAEFRPVALPYIDTTLNRWKLEQADADGTVELPPLGTGLLDLVLDPTPRRVSVETLRPEQCAGPFVHCAADLWSKLLVDKYAPVVDADKRIPFDVVMALLIERDGTTMPVESLVTALHYVWISAWVGLKVYRDALKDADRGRMDKRVAAKVLQSFKKDNEESPKKWAKSRHQTLLADSYGAHRYPKIGPTERGKWLYKEYGSRKSAKWKWVEGADGKRHQVLTPSEGTFVDYVREFERHRQRGNDSPA